MKKLILFALINIFCLAINHAQTAIGYNLLSNKAKVEKPEIIEEFKSTTTVFIARPDDDLDILAEELNKVWKMTPLLVVDYEEAEDYLGQSEYSLFSISGFTIQNEKSYCPYFYLSLSFIQLNKKEEPFQYEIARMELHPDVKTVFAGLSNKDNEFSEHMYYEAELKNWNELMIINFVKQVNDKLKKNEAQAFYQKKYKDEQLAKLKRDTLYIPDFVLVDFNPFSGKEGSLSLSELFANYPFPYKKVTKEELLNKYLNSKKSFYYLLSVKSCNKTLINIVNGQTGKVVYSDYPKLWSYKLKTKDIKQITSSVKKASKSRK